MGLDIELFVFLPAQHLVNIGSLCRINVKPNIFIFEQ